MLVITYALVGKQKHIANLSYSILKGLAMCFCLHLWFPPSDMVSKVMINPKGKPCGMAQP